MKKNLKKSSITLSLAFITTTSLLASEPDRSEEYSGSRKRPFDSLNIVEEEKRKKRRFSLTEEVERSTFNLSEAIENLNNGDFSQRGIIIEKIYQGLFLQSHLEFIHLPHLFPSLENNNFEALDLKEMVVYQGILLLRKAPVAKAFMDRINGHQAPTNSLLQYMLGSAYFTGNGISKNINKAFELFTYSAIQGCAIAQFYVGASYQKGQGVAQSPHEAFKWYQQAAQQGFAQAQFQVGMAYLKGEGVAQNDLEAFKWYQQAAQQGFAPAQFQVGASYQKGQGVAQSPHEAFKWYQQAAQQGFAPAQFQVGVSYQEGKGVAQSPHEAFKWYQQAAQQGFAQAQYKVGMAYLKGEGVARSNSEAFKCFQEAAKQGHSMSRQTLKQCFGKANLDIILTPQYSVSEEVEKQIKEIKSELQALQALYIFHAAQARQTNFEDSLGEHLYLSQLCSNIVSDIKPYEEFLEYIGKPGFLVSSIHTNNILEFLSHAERSKDPFKNFVCWNGYEVIEAIQSKQLEQDLNKLNELNGKSLEILSECGREPDALKKMLVLVKISNTDLFKYLSPFLTPYQSVNDNIIISEEQWQKIEDYLHELNKWLPTHPTYAKNLYGTLENLALKTEAYHNTLFSQTYPWFFK